MLRATCLTALTLLTFAIGQPALSQAYRITDLGANAYPQSVNDSGSVAGHVTYPASGKSASYNRAFVRIGNTQSEIGTLGGKSSEARAINDNGIVVGHSLNAAGARRAFVWANGSLQDLNGVRGSDGRCAADLGWTLTAAFGINNKAQIVGLGTHPTEGKNLDGTRTDYDTFLWQKDADGNVKVTAVSLQMSQYETRGINDSGVVAGSVEYIAQDSYGEYSTVQASVWSEGINTNLGFLPGGDYSHAYSINSSAEVVGFSYSSQGTRAFLWSNGGGMFSLGTLGTPDNSRLASCAFNNNEIGQVVGWADRSTSDKDSHYRRAFVWDADNKMRDLNSLSNVGTSWYLQQARDISNQGRYIVGYGFVKVKNGSQARGVLLTP
jgi:probable HAF family extracellular repeat protein